MRIFGCKFYVHKNGKDSLGKLNPRGDEDVFLGYSSRSKAYIVFNKRTNKVEENIHVVFDESSVLQGKDHAQEDDFSFPQAQVSGSTTVIEDRDSDDEDLTPQLVPTCATPEIVPIQGEEDDILEDSEQSPEHTDEAHPGYQPLSPRTQAIM